MSFSNSPKKAISLFFSTQASIALWTVRLLWTLFENWLLSVHLRLLSNVGRFSLIKCRHTWFINCCTCFQFLQLAGCWSPKFPGGKELYGRWMSKWVGVSVSSFSGWSATFVKGLEFRIATNSTIIVSVMSKERRLDLRMIKSVFLALWINRSHTPTK